jgi:hypothetical protein
LYAAGLFVFFLLAVLIMFHLCYLFFVCALSRRRRWHRHHLHFSWTQSTPSSQETHS